MTGEVDRIGEKVKRAIAGNDMLVSAVVIWEVAIKRQLGKLDAPSDLLDQLEAAGVGLLPITPRHADRVGTLPPHHRDPFDRLLVAQAECDGLVLATADEDLRLYEAETIW
jgi:PIN domain nuclease of toxin-antitoxin system